MNTIISHKNNETLTLKHKEHVLDKIVSCCQPILIALISRINTVNINRTNTKISVQLSFNNDYSQN